MSVELLSGTTNVVRFPIERRARPTLELLRGIGVANEAAFIDDGHDGGFGVGEGRIGFGNRPL